MNLTRRHIFKLFFLLEVMKMASPNYCDSCEGKPTSQIGQLKIKLKTKEWEFHLRNKKKANGKKHEPHVGREKCLLWALGNRREESYEKSSWNSHTFLLLPFCFQISRWEGEGWALLIQKNSKDIWYFFLIKDDGVQIDVPGAWPIQLFENAA